MLLCVGQCEAGMIKAVQTMAFVRNVPVIKIEVVEHCSSYDAFSVERGLETKRHFITGICHCQTVKISRGITMLDVLMHFKEFFIFMKLLQCGDKVFNALV